MQGAQKQQVKETRCDIVYWPIVLLHEVWLWLTAVWR